MRSSQFNEGKRVINGTHGMLWLDGEEMAEVIAFQAKDEYQKEAVKIARRMNTSYKIIGVESKGSVKLHKVDSKLIQKIGRMVRDGKTPTFTLQSKLADPDSFGCESIQLLNVVFDDLTIADWENGVLGTIEAPFTYEDYTRISVIEV